MSVRAHRRPLPPPATDEVPPGEVAELAARTEAEPPARRAGDARPPRRPTGDPMRSDAFRPPPSTGPVARRPRHHPWPPAAHPGAAGDHHPGPARRRGQRGPHRLPHRPADHRRGTPGAHRAGPGRGAAVRAWPDRRLAGRRRRLPEGDGRLPGRGGSPGAARWPACWPAWPPDPGRGARRWPSWTPPSRPPGPTSTRRRPTGPSRSTTSPAASPTSTRSTSAWTAPPTAGCAGASPP